MLGRNVADMIQTLRYGEAADRRSALAELAQIAPEAGEAIPDLIAVLHDVDPSLRSAAADAIARTGAAAVAPLVEAMLEDNVDFRKAVIGTLGRIGPGAKAAIPVLKAAQGDPRLVAEADAAMAQINPPIWAMLRPHLVGSLPAAMLISGGAAAATVTLIWLAHLLEPLDPLAVIAGRAMGLISGLVGFLMGAITRGPRLAFLGFIIFGLTGYFVGIFIGGWAGSLLGPLGR